MKQTREPHRTHLEADDALIAPRWQLSAVLARGGAGRTARARALVHVHRIHLPALGRG
jgi:hypothetical protein